MDFNINGEVELDKTEKEIVLKGLKLVTTYCDTRLGCAGCPFYLGYENCKQGATYCELKSSLPCAWVIPDKWTEEGTK